MIGLIVGGANFEYGGGPGTGFAGPRGGFLSFSSSSGLPLLLLPLKPPPGPQKTTIRTTRTTPGLDLGVVNLKVVNIFLT